MGAALPFFTLVASGLSAGIQAFASYRQGQAQAAAAEYQSQVMRNNAVVAERRAQDSLLRGARAEQEKRLETAQRIAGQRAAFAAAGVAVDEGSPLNVYADTAMFGELDALTIRTNAQNEAQAFRYEHSHECSKRGPGLSL